MDKRLHLVMSRFCECEFWPKSVTRKVGVGMPADWSTESVGDNPAFGSTVVVLPWNECPRAMLFVIPIELASISRAAESPLAHCPPSATMSPSVPLPSGSGSLK